MTTTPVEVTVEADDGADVALYVVSRGISYETPAGNRIQYANDIVWSGSATPGTAVVRDANLRNGATYDVRARATDPETGLSSDLATATFRVAWADSPVAPDAEVSASGTSATISTAAADGMGDSDVYDVYRVTKNGVYPVASDVKPGSTLVDQVLPVRPVRLPGVDEDRERGRAVEGLPLRVGARRHQARLGRQVGRPALQRRAF